MKKQLLVSCISALATLSYAEVSLDYTYLISNPSFEINAFNNDQAEVENWIIENTYEGWGRIALWDDNSADGKWHLSTWTDVITEQNIYQELLDLPKGNYTLSAQMRTNKSDDLTDQHIYVEINGVPYTSAPLSEAGVGESVNNWEKLSVEFIVDSDAPVKIGAKSTGGENPGGGKGWFKLDDFKLFFISNDDKAMIEALTKKIEYAQNIDTGNYTAKALKDLSDAIEAAQNTMDDVSGIEAAILQIDNAIEYGNESAKVLVKYYDAVFNAEDIYDSSEDGTEKDALGEFINESYNIINDETKTNQDYADATIAVNEYVNNAIDSLQPAEGYYFDFTKYIVNPSFEYNVSGNGQSISSIENFGWEFEEDASGWGSLSLWNDFSGDGTYHLSTAREVINSQKVYQKISNLKSGKYVLTAVMRTNVIEHLTDQHIYLTVGSETSKAFMSEAGIGTNNLAWENLSIPFELNANNQPIEIGVASTGDGSQSGWFKADDFRIQYHGPSNNPNNIENTIVNQNTVRGCKGYIEINAVENGSAVIYKIDGTVASKTSIQKGINNINIEKGIYIVNGKLIIVS